MKIYIDDFKNLKNNEPLTVTIGNFDGIHIGHQKLISIATSYTDTKSALLTFDPHPAKLLKDLKHRRLMSLNDKLEILKKTSLDKAYIVNFTKELMSLSVDEFINFLKSLSVKRVVVGRDFRFGAYAKGNADDLAKHFLLEVVDDVLINNTRASSTYVKELIHLGEMEKAKNILSRYYQIEGKVIHGDKVGRTLGIPTANLDYSDFYLPPNGVYYSVVEVDGKNYAGALNIGYNPTINYSEKKRVEVHLLDFSEEIYGKVLKIKIVKYLRPEKRFKTREELISHMENDLKTCEKLFLLEKLT